MPISRNPGDGLILNAVDASAGFTDAQLAAFLPYAPYIVEMELGRTSVTNACFGTLGKFPHLRASTWKEPPSQEKASPRSPSFPNSGIST